MRLNRKTAPGFRNCKIKPVDPAFRSVSTPRQPKDLHVVGPVYREASIGRADGGLSARNGAPKASAFGSRERPRAGPKSPHCRLGVLPYQCRDAAPIAPRGGRLSSRLVAPKAATAGHKPPPEGQPNDTAERESSRLYP
jgi:hypothetical protein